MGDLDAALIKQLVNSVELIVYKAFKGSYIQHTNALRRVTVQLGQYGKERCLGLTAGGRRGEKQVVVGIKNSFCRRNLHASQAFP